MSIVFLYFRILDGRRGRLLLWGTQVANFLVMASFIISLGLSSRPSWSHWAYSHDVERSHCPDTWDWDGYYTGFNLVLDVWMIVISTWKVWDVPQLDRNARLGVIAMFCLGVW